MNRFYDSFLYEDCRTNAELSYVAHENHAFAALLVFMEYDWEHAGFADWQIPDLNEYLGRSIEVLNHMGVPERQRTRYEGVWILSGRRVAHG